MITKTLIPNPFVSKRLYHFTGSLEVLCKVCDICKGDKAQQAKQELLDGTKTSLYMMLINSTPTEEMQSFIVEAENLGAKVEELITFKLK